MFVYEIDSGSVVLVSFGQLDRNCKLAGKKEPQREIASITPACGHVWEDFLDCYFMWEGSIICLVIKFALWQFHACMQ